MDIENDSEFETVVIGSCKRLRWKSTRCSVSVQVVFIETLVVVVVVVMWGHQSLLVSSEFGIGGVQVGADELELVLLNPQLLCKTEKSKLIFFCTDWSWERFWVVSGNDCCDNDVDDDAY